VWSQIRGIARLWVPQPSILSIRPATLAILVARMALLEGPPVISRKICLKVSLSTAVCYVPWEMAIPHPATRVHLLTLHCPVPRLVSGEGDTGQHKKEILIR